MIVSVTPETSADIAALVAANFRSFGGGQARSASWNPISSALKDTPAQFAGGVDIQEVVDFIIPLAIQITESELAKELAITKDLLASARAQTDLALAASKPASPNAKKPKA